MSVTNDTATEAQRNQIPPELREFAREHARNVSELSRFNSENESTARGWNLVAETIQFRHLPDGYQVTLTCRDGNGIDATIREA